MHKQELINRALVSAQVSLENGFSNTSNAFLEIVADVLVIERELASSTAMRANDNCCLLSPQIRNRISADGVQKPSLLCYAKYPGSGLDLDMSRI